jgi:two-component system LytT family response regulator
MGLAWSVIDNRDSLGILSADRRLFAPATIVGVWTVVAMAAALQAVALVRLDGRADMAGAVLGRLSIIPLWAIATPFILRSAGRFPVVGVENRVDIPSVATHLALGSAFIVVANLAIRVPIAFLESGGLVALARSTMQGVAEYFPAALVVYGVIVAIGHFVFRPPAANPPATNPATPPPPSTARLEDGVAPSIGMRPEAPASTTTATATMDGHITVRQWNRVHFVRVDDIDFVEAEDNYVVVHAASRAYKGRDRISDVASQLDARRFVRIHRSTIVHVAKIREIQPLTHGDHAVILRDGKVLRVARSRRQALELALGVEL